VDGFWGETHVERWKELGNVDDGKRQNGHGKASVDRLLRGSLSIVFVDDVPQDKRDGKRDHAARVLHVVHSEQGKGQGDVEQLDPDDICPRFEGGVSGSRGLGFVSGLWALKSATICSGGWSPADREQAIEDMQASAPVTLCVCAPMHSCA
jgi:hypothetical protein